ERPARRRGSCPRSPSRERAPTLRMARPYRSPEARGAQRGDASSARPRRASRFHRDDVVPALAVDQLAVRIDAGANRLARHGDADRLPAAADAVALEVQRFADAVEREVEVGIDRWAARE